MNYFEFNQIWKQFVLNVARLVPVSQKINKILLQKFEQVAMDWEAELLENLVTQPVPGKPKRLKFNAMAERR